MLIILSWAASIYKNIPVYIYPELEGEKLSEHNNRYSNTAGIQGHNSPPNIIP